MSIAADLRAKLRLPVMAGPMFIASTADLVIAQCCAGIIGSMPALNPRTTADLDADITRIAASVGDAPYAINLVAHASNSRLGGDLDGLDLIGEVGGHQRLEGRRQDRGAERARAPGLSRVW